MLILRETMTLHDVFIQTLGELVKQILLHKDLFSARQISVYPLEYLPQTLKQKSNTCIPLCLVCKFVSSVTLLSNSFATFWHVLWVSIFTPTPLCSLYLPNFIFFPLKTHDGLKIFIFFFFSPLCVCIYIWLVIESLNWFHNLNMILSVLVLHSPSLSLKLLIDTYGFLCTAMAGVAPEGSQFDARQFDAKMEL